MTGITPAQNRKIHVLARDKGMDTENLHDYIECLTGKTSIRNLTIMEAVTVIDALEGRQKSESENHMTKKQEHYLKCLAKENGMIDETGELDEKRLDGFCRARYNVMRYSWLTRQQASKVIEGLKAMVERNGGNENEGKGN